MNMITDILLAIYSNRTFNILPGLLHVTLIKQPDTGISK